jgi:hypothetical protein
VAQVIKLIHVESHSGHPLIKKVMKKFFDPALFELSFIRIADEQFASVRQKTIDRPDYPRLFEQPTFNLLSVTALCALEISPDAHAAIVLQHRPVVPASGVASQLGVFALLLDARRRPERPWEYAHAEPFPSYYMMPYLGESGSTAEQVERGQRTVLRGVIEGWREWSRRHGGITRHPA